MQYRFQCLIFRQFAERGPGFDEKNVRKGSQQKNYSDLSFKPLILKGIEFELIPIENQLHYSVYKKYCRLIILSTHLAFFNL